MKQTKNFRRHLLAAALGVACGAACCLLSGGCTTTVTPGANGATTTTKGIDPASVALIDQAVANIISNAPAAIADAQAISALVHGTNK